MAARLHEFLDADVLAAANIHPETGLATDYLNHFNEPAMLIAMLPECSEVQEDVLAWRRLDYAAHFDQSGFRDRDLAIAAYHLADPAVRRRFDDACLRAEGLVNQAQECLREGCEPADFVGSLSSSLYAAIAEANAIIHAQAALGSDQADIDALFS